MKAAADLLPKVTWSPEILIFDSAFIG